MVASLPTPADVRFVLVEPQSGGNVGAAARALHNLGFRGLRLVAPRCDRLGADARRMAVDATGVLEESQVDADLDAALAGAGAVVGTTARTGKQRNPHWRLDAFAPEAAALARAAPIAFVFGRETHGLSDAELDRCTHLVRFPASPDNPSFNLSQAVLLVAWELRLALEGEAPPALDPPAAHEAREAMYTHLEAALRAIGYLHGDSSEPMMRRLRRLVGRAAPTSVEVQMLRGIARQILWLAARDDAQWKIAER